MKRRSIEFPYRFELYIPIKRAPVIYIYSMLDRNLCQLSGETPHLILMGNVIASHPQTSELEPLELELYRVCSSVLSGFENQIFISWLMYSFYVSHAHQLHG